MIIMCESIPAASIPLRGKTLGKPRAFFKKWPNARLFQQFLLANAPAPGSYFHGQMPGPQSIRH